MRVYCDKCKFVSTWEGMHDASVGLGCFRSLYFGSFRWRVARISLKMIDTGIVLVRFVDGYLIPDPAREELMQAMEAHKGQFKSLKFVLEETCEGFETRRVFLSNEAVDVQKEPNDWSFPKWLLEKVEKKLNKLK